MTPIEEIKFIHSDVARLKEPSLDNASGHLSRLLIEVIERLEVLSRILDAINTRNERVEKYMMERDRVMQQEQLEQERNRDYLDALR